MIKLADRPTFKTSQARGIPPKDILKFLKENWYWIYPILQSGWEIVRQAYEKWKKKRDKRKQK